MRHFRFLLLGIAITFLASLALFKGAGVYPPSVAVSDVVDQHAIQETGFEKTAKVKSVNEIFEEELRSRNVEYSGPDAEGLYTVERDDGSCSISLHNIARTYQTSGDPETVRRFVQQVLLVLTTPPWEVARSQLFLSAEPGDSQVGNAIHWKVSDFVVKVLVLSAQDEGRIRWVDPGMLTQWGVSEEVALATAEANLDGLLKGVTPELAPEIDGMSLAMVPVDSVFKASAIFAPSFKDFVSQKLEWPVLVVIPCRDFMYILSENDKALLNRMGHVVQREFRKSPYPITTEVLRVSDEGIQGIGSFPQ